MPGSATGIEYSIGRFDSYNNVTFRLISRMVLSLRTSENLTNSLTLNYRSGNHDRVLTEDDAAVRVVNADDSIGGVVGMTRDVDDYLTLDYQLKAKVYKGLTLTAGIKNLLVDILPFVNGRGFPLLASDAPDGSRTERAQLLIQSAGYLSTSPKATPDWKKRC
ncbi:hypothetical protein [Massilia cavernae]|uniref:TonB-dependent receptor n=1 Tax=Massilia cavernae TaxID=2320864 RepID=A0A418XGA3_9BURK|nr:hypothetical protein [Massilia cavernae]RJG11489.1 hypothetical protein D3872_19570 [Massilia cavernae]